MQKYLPVGQRELPFIQKDKTYVNGDNGEGNDSYRRTGSETQTFTIQINKCMLQKLK